MTGCSAGRRACCSTTAPARRLLAYGAPPRGWPPDLRRCCVRAMRPAGTVEQRWQGGARAGQLRGLERLRDAAGRDQGVVLAPNLAARTGPFVLVGAGDPLGRPF